MFLRNIFLTLIVCLITVGMSLALAIPDSTAEDKILSQLRQAYHSLCADCRYEFKQLRVPPLSSKWVDQLRVGTEGVGWSGSFLVTLESGGQNVGWASGQVKILRQGFVAKRALQPGETLHGPDFDREWVDVTFLKDQLASAEDLQRMTPKRFLGIRQALLMSDLRKAYIVQRGQTLKVVYGGDVFEISTQMKAEENGAIGDLIQVKNNESQKIISARVSPDGSARIE